MMDRLRVDAVLSADAGWVRSPDSPKSPRHRARTLRALQGCTGDLALPLTSHVSNQLLQSPSAFVGSLRLLDHARPSVAHLAPAPQ